MTLKNLSQMHLKVLQKASLKTTEATGDLIVKRLLIELQTSQKIRYRIV